MELRELNKAIKIREELVVNHNISEQHRKEFLEQLKKLLLVRESLVSRGSNERTL